MSDRIVSAVFDSREEAERALSQLRSSGVRESAISVVGRREDGSVSSSADNDDDDDAKSDVVKGAVIGTGAGALLGIAALAIPGVGPLAAAGAIAATAIPEAAAIGAGAGLAAGSVSGLLASHGVSEEDSAYYEERLNSGGTFLSVDTSEADLPADAVRDILYSNGGHSAGRARTDAM
jgi:hypothetical protein